MKHHLVTIECTAGELDPDSQLTYRDLLQRAEELEALAEHFLVGESHKHFIKQRAYRLRQQAKELAKCHSPKT